MQLHMVPRNSWIRLKDENPKVPPAAPSLTKGQEILFHHLDGMYSLCEDKQGNIVHLVAWAEVEIVSEDQISPVDDPTF